MLGRSQQGAKPALPLLDVEVVLVLQRAPEHRRELMECLEQLALNALDQREVLDQENDLLVFPRVRLTNRCWPAGR